MKKNLLTILVFALLSFGFYSYFSHQNSNVISGDFSNWQTFTPDSNLFRVSFPQSPLHREDLIPSKENPQIRRFDRYLSENVDGALFLITVSTYSPENTISQDAQTTLEESVQEIVSGNPSNDLINLSFGTFKGYESADFLIRNEEYRIDGKAILDGNRVYVLTYSPNDTEFSPETYAHFIDSFQILKK